ncbi:DRG2 [Cordylochernes scorpioides]|uniref:DRG2 n=1 Tax=Cordylochernes scorpioides TaxID=51811 RepID=A0ABY6JYL1_9ARAC|nr:DRG2 [Cordylochernes scorpioides]
MGILEKITEIEREISRTQKNKATEYHLGVLKAKLAKYRSQLLEPQGKKEKMSQSGLTSMMEEGTERQSTLTVHEYIKPWFWQIDMAVSIDEAIVELNISVMWLQGEGFDVMKSGDARVSLIGFPSVGKVS